MIIHVNLGKESYDITVQQGALRRAGQILELKRKVLIVTDDGVPEQYIDAVTGFCKEPVIAVIPQGEGSKSLEYFEKLCTAMMENGFTRSDCVVAVGGGVCGDLAGFAASCYMRGVDFYNIPTTLLSQVDSSVGGKTAVDLMGIKNIVGTFYQPKAVIVDTEVLNTLDHRQFSCGAAEIIKMAAAFDKALFELIEKNGVRSVLDRAITGALSIKTSVVEKDQREQGLRRALNFGHTLGHGIESVSGRLHGECVAIGMIPMCGPDLKQRMKDVLKREGLATTLREAEEQGKTKNCGQELYEQAKLIADAALHDKKAKAGKVVTVQVNEIGSFEFKDMDEQQLTEACWEVIG